MATAARTGSKSDSASAVHSEFRPSRAELSIHVAGLAVLAVLHQPSLAARHADRVVGLRDGRVILDRPPGQDVDALYRPAVMEAVS